MNVKMSFTIIIGPAAITAPKGQRLLTVYVMQCTLRQYNRARAGNFDRSKLMIEGSQEPHVDDKSRPYTAIVATA